MDEIVLKMNLKYVLAALSMNERGELLTALLEGEYQGHNQGIENVYRYIASLQQETSLKKQYMKELSAKGVAARLKKLTAGQPTVLSAVNQRSLRKEAKESINKNNINLFFKNGDEENSFVPPSLPEVQAYVTKEGLDVDAKNFVNFYESHGWMVGKTPIRNWQATVQLWHTRAHLKKSPPNDEKYWTALEKRVDGQTTQSEVVKKEPPPSVDILAADVSLSARQNLPSELHHLQMSETETLPFARFMRRVEKYDIKSEKIYDE